MKTKSRDPSPRQSLTLPLRLPAEDVAFLDAVAREQCNTRGGIIRLAISQMRKACEGRQPGGAPESHSPAGGLRIIS